jgi:hypothetical protein
LRYFTLLEQLLINPDNAQDQLVRLSMMAGCSVFDESNIEFHIQQMESCRASKRNFTVPKVLFDFIASERVQHAFKQAAGSYFTSEYKFPPEIVIVENVSHELYGWVAFNNTIAISSYVVRRMEETGLSCDILSFLNVVGHESAHGVFRSGVGTWNTGTPLKFEREMVAGVQNLVVQESGERYERALWGGYVLSWHNPLNPAAAEKIADYILDQLSDTGQFPELTENQVQDMVSLVGLRTTSYQSGQNMPTAFYFRIWDSPVTPQVIM